MCKEATHPPTQTLNQTTRGYLLHEIQSRPITITTLQICSNIVFVFIHRKCKGMYNFLLKEHLKWNISLKQNYKLKNI